MRRILIVSPHFPPVNAPDMQRARMALPYLRQHGWEPVVLAIAPDYVEGAVLDPLLEHTYPADIKVVRVRGIHSRHTRRFGFGSLWLRCGRAIRQAGDALLAAEKFDAVFLTTTQFDAFTLGPRWLKRFGVPYVLDYQDPWINDYYHKTKTRPPGGAVKYWLAQFTARRREPRVLRHAAAVIAVSTAYAPELMARYPGLDPTHLHHLPFGAARSDLEIARRHRPPVSLVPLSDGLVHFVYAGRCGPDMSNALTLLFQAFRRYLDSHPENATKMRFHFIGTDYAPPPLGRYWALPIAETENVSSYVTEHCYRVPYFDALHYLTIADALIAVGSNDATYSASKIFPYLFAQRPLLTIVHEASLMLQLAREQNIMTSYGFPAQQETPAAYAAVIQRIHDEWFVQEGFKRVPTGDLERLAQHTAAGMTARLAAILDQAVVSRQLT